jgi:hypothetical protein
MSATVGTLSWWWLVIASDGLTPVIVIVVLDRKSWKSGSWRLSGRNGVMAFFGPLVSATGVAEEQIIRTHGGIFE